MERLYNLLRENESHLRSINSRKDVIKEFRLLFDESCSDCLFGNLHGIYKKYEAFIDKLAQCDYFVLDDETAKLMADIIKGKN